MSIRIIPAAATLVFAALAACGGGRSEPATNPAPARDALPADQAATVDSKTIEQTPGESVDKILQGRVAGVVVNRTADGGLAIRIRGSTSVYGNNEPLYILDGMPIDPGPNGSINGLNPYDIESIKVLKDPTDTAMYGSRGANGVIIIKTKKPGQR